MDWNIGKEIAALQQMTVRELRQRYAAVFAEETHANNKAWLVKRILWCLQALWPKATCPSAPASAPPSWPTTPTCA